MTAFGETPNTTREDAYAPHLAPNVQTLMPNLPALLVRGLFWSDRVPTLEGSPVVGTVRCNQRLTYFDYGGIALLKRQRCGFIRAWGTVPGVRSANV